MLEASVAEKLSVKRPWIRVNPKGLSPEQVAVIRKGPHLTDVDLSGYVVRALLRAGHRWAGELRYMSEDEVRAVHLIGPSAVAELKWRLGAVGVEIGGARKRVFYPT